MPGVRVYGIFVRETVGRRRLLRCYIGRDGRLGADPRHVCDLLRNASGMCQ